MYEYKKAMSYLVKSEEDLLRRLNRLTSIKYSEYSISVTVKSNSYIQLKSKYTVDYLWRLKIAYVLETHQQFSDIHLEKAIILSLLKNKQKMNGEIKRAKGNRGSTRTKKQLLYDNPFCYLCNKKLTEKTATLDHVIPKAKGGTNRRVNLRLACWPCNRDKKDMMLDDYLGSN